MADTRATTGPESRAERRAAAGLALLVGSALLALSLPRLAGAFALLPGDWIERKIQFAEQRVSVDELGLLIETRREAAGYARSGPTLSEKGRAELMLANERRATLDFQGAWPLVQDAVESLSAALSLTPGDGYAWADLAYARGQGIGHSPRTAAALENSMRFAPNAKRLVLWRLDDGLAELPLLDAEGKALLQQQARLAWRLDPRSFKQIARARHASEFLRAALRQDPELATAAEQALDDSP